MSADDSLFIYALCEPDGVTVRYVGCSRRPEQRLLEHLADGRGKRPSSPRIAWLRSLVQQGLRPTLLILACVPASLAAQEECRFVTEHLERGCVLTNVMYGREAPTRRPNRPGLVFGARMRALREQQLLTQAELAALLGVHHTEVSHWETGRNLPHPGRQRQIVCALGLTPQEFAQTDTTGTSEDTR